MALMHRLLQQHIMYGKAPCRETCLTNPLFKYRQRYPSFLRALFSADPEHGVAGGQFWV